jgi:hypothetical protein
MMMQPSLKSTLMRSGGMPGISQRSTIASPVSLMSTRGEKLLSIDHWGRFSGGSSKISHAKKGESISCCSLIKVKGADGRRKFHSFIRLLYWPHQQAHKGYRKFAERSKNGLRRRVNRSNRAQSHFMSVNQARAAARDRKKGRMLH